MPYLDVAQPVFMTLPVDSPDVTSNHSHVNLMNSASEVAMPSGGEEDDDVEEDLLRAQLLMSLARKRKEKEDAEVSEIDANCQNIFILFMYTFLIDIDIPYSTHVSIKRF